MSCNPLLIGEIQLCKRALLTRRCSIYSSGYSLYSKIMLRELKDIPSKEKMAEISRRWKEQLSEEERQEYTKQATEV